jgi:hypothetical protein
MKKSFSEEISIKKIAKIFFLLLLQFHGKGYFFVKIMLRMKDEKIVYI